MDGKAELLGALQRQIINCERCPRLVEWRTRVARERVRRYRDEVYWGRAVPSFGDAEARLLIVGLAPAAHGGNRTGRVFTGDRSGDWLYRALFKAGFANQPTSVHRDDGLRLTDCYITAVIHCAPPDNKPLPEEVSNCRPYLLTEIESLDTVRVVVALGRIAFDAVLAAFKTLGPATAGKGKKPLFGHGAECQLTGSVSLIASFHPSQQNTFTGRLTEPMFDSVFARARSILESGRSGNGDME
ncbi:MAG TPA: uracil-DNA glycosylase [Blastocatellia bacterium]|nr:uracil-DNA glycosylase [Blastocatellia bacterium]